jgi:hypothetical protein
MPWEMAECRSTGGGRGRLPRAGYPTGRCDFTNLSNIYLHDVLDRWFAEVAKPRLRGDAFLIRFADDGAPRAHLNIGILKYYKEQKNNGLLLHLGTDTK